MSDFAVQTVIDRDAMIDALRENPEQLAYILLELPSRLSEEDREDVLIHLDGPGEVNEATQFWGNVADKIAGII